MLLWLCSGLVSSVSASVVVVVVVVVVIVVVVLLTSNNYLVVVVVVGELHPSLLCCEKDFVIPMLVNCCACLLLCAMYYLCFEGRFGLIGLWR